MHVGSNGKRSKTEAMYCPACTATYGDGNTSDLMLDCGGTVSFTESFVYLGSLLHYDLSADHEDVEARATCTTSAFRQCSPSGHTWRRTAPGGTSLLVTTPPFAIGKPFVRQPRGDTKVTPEDKRRAVAQRAAEIAERRAVFDANNNN